MNLVEMSKDSKRAVANNRLGSVMTSSTWQDAANMITNVAIPTNLKGGNDSFIENSEVFRHILKQFNVDDMSIPQLILISASAKAIEDGNDKCATFVRDTTGGKPVDKVDIHQHKNLTDLSDEELAFIEAHAEVVKNG